MCNIVFFAGFSKLDDGEISLDLFRFDEQQFVRNYENAM